jgi:integrase
LRLVPVHSQLIALGFLDWVTAQKTKDPQTRLFPLIHPKGSLLVSLWFTRLLRVLQVKRPAVSLHSLRHTMTVKLERNRTHPSIMHRLLGHAVGADVEARVYLASLTYSPKELQEALEAVKFPTIS